MKFLAITLFFMSVFSFDAEIPDDFYDDTPGSVEANLVDNYYRVYSKVHRKYVKIFLEEEYKEKPTDDENIDGDQDDLNDQSQNNDNDENNENNDQVITTTLTHLEGFVINDQASTVSTVMRTVRVVQTVSVIVGTQIFPYVDENGSTILSQTTTSIQPTNDFTVITGSSVFPTVVGSSTLETGIVTPTEPFTIITGTVLFGENAVDSSASAISYSAGLLIFLVFF